MTIEIDENDLHAFLDGQLAPEQEAVVLAWLETDMPRGKETDMPPPRKFPEGWMIGTPDVVISMPAEFDVPAETPRGGVLMVLRPLYEAGLGGPLAGRVGVVVDPVAVILVVGEVRVVVGPGPDLGMIGGQVGHAESQRMSLAARHRVLPFDDVRAQGPRLGRGGIGTVVRHHQQPRVGGKLL